MSNQRRQATPVQQEALLTRDNLFGNNPRRERAFIEGFLRKLHVYVDPDEFRRDFQLLAELQVLWDHYDAPWREPEVCAAFIDAALEMCEPGQEDAAQIFARNVVLAGDFMDTDWPVSAPSFSSHNSLCSPAQAAVRRLQNRRSVSARD